MLFPPLAAACLVMLLPRTTVNARIVAGIGLSFPYLLVALMYVLMSAKELPLEVAFPWLVWAFVAGVGSSVVADRFRLGCV